MQYLNSYRADIAYNASLPHAAIETYPYGGEVTEYYNNVRGPILAFQGIEDLDAQLNGSTYEQAKCLEFAALAGHYDLVDSLMRKMPIKSFYECHFQWMSDYELASFLNELDDSLLTDRLGNIAKAYEMEIAEKPYTMHFFRDLVHNFPDDPIPYLEEYESDKSILVPVEVGNYDAAGALPLNTIAELSTRHRPLTMDAARMYAQLSDDWELLSYQIAEGLGGKALRRIWDECNYEPTDDDIADAVATLGPAFLHH